MFSHRIFKSTIFRLAILILPAVCSSLAQNAPKKPAAQKKTLRPAKAPTVAEAQAFMKKAEDQLEDLVVRSSRAGWVQENFITDDTETMAAQANEKLAAVTTQFA